MGGLEGRYWLGSKEKRINSEVLTGHFLGLYAGGGKYDLQWKEDGYQGEFFIAAGISYGWATRIARNLHLEVTTMPVITTKLYCGKIMGVTPGSDRQRRKSRWYGC